MESNLLFERKRVGKLLSDVLDGVISPEIAREDWPQYIKDKLLDNAFHELYHFEDDADIRFKDEKYDKWQREHIQNIINKLTG